jgi:hypothetical protein
MAHQSIDLPKQVFGNDDMGPQMLVPHRVRSCVDLCVLTCSTVKESPL